MVVTINGDRNVGTGGVALEADHPRIFFPRRFWNANECGGLSVALTGEADFFNAAIGRVPALDHGAAQGHAWAGINTIQSESLAQASLQVLLPRAQILWRDRGIPQARLICGNQGAVAG